MGIVRLAKCLRILNSIDEYTSREQDIKNKIPGNRVYMDFVSIVYKIQDKVVNELNYLLFCFILIEKKLLNTIELTSNKFVHMLMRYNKSIPDYGKIYDILVDVKKTNNEMLGALQEIINRPFIDQYIIQVRSLNVLNNYVYESIIYFIVDMLTQKIIDVEYVLISFDGVPSYGKIQEQRKRRYMRFAFLEFQKVINTKNESVPLGTGTLVRARDMANIMPIIGARYVYDSNHFQPDIKSAIEYVYAMYHGTNLQRDIVKGMTMSQRNGINITPSIVEVIDRPYGEGEKILMDQLVDDYKKYGDEKSYVFYSPDGDSVILCLYIYVKTGVKKLNVVKNYSLEPSDKHNEQTQYVDINTLQENIVSNIEKYAHIKIETQYDRNSICTDFIFMVNLYGNDFIHQVPTMEISTTIMDLIYCYSKYIKNNDYILRKVGDKIHINYGNLKIFFKELSEFENLMMLDTYILDINDRNKIINYFGNIFSCRYALDFREIVQEYKHIIYHDIKNGNSNLASIKKMVADMIDAMNQTVTVSGKKYGDIFIKMEIKNVNSYASKIAADPEYLLLHMPKLVYGIRPKKNKNEHEIRTIINELENDLIKNNSSINQDNVTNSNNKKIRDFSFDYNNIRTLIPHAQMPTTDGDIDLYLLEWKSGKWMDILNAYPYELGYDWKRNRVKNIDQEMKRYQYDMLDINNTQMNRMIVDYLRTLSWMVDYYMNTDSENTLHTISTWSYNYERSPFITHIHRYLEAISGKELNHIMKNTYKKSLVSTDMYLKPDRHKLYIYPQPPSTISRLPGKYRISFPDMTQYVAATITMAKNEKNQIDRDKQHQRSRDLSSQEPRLFDCRMCPYFSKCIFKNKPLKFKELMSLDVMQLNHTNQVTLNRQTLKRSFDNYMGK
jgi:5'-3' exonuclease